MRTSESIKNIASALIKAQRKMGAASKSASNPFFKSKYADLGAVMEVVKGPLNEEGIAVLQPASSKDGSHYVETILVHESGEFIASEPLKLELNKIDMQQLGSAISYARRYTLQSLTFVPSEDLDAEDLMVRSKSTHKQEAPKLTSVPAPAEVVAPSAEATKPKTSFRKSTPAAPASNGSLF